MSIDFSKFTSIDDVPSLADGPALKELVEEASSFLASRSWCKEVKGGYLVFGVAPYFAIFLMVIDPAGGAPSRLWVMVGDIPPAVATLENCPTAVKAVHEFAHELEAWGNAVISKASIEEFMPMLRRGSWLPIEPSEKAADLAFRRSKLLRTSIIPEMQRILP